MSDDLGKVLLAKSDTVVEKWIESVRKNADNIESSKELAFKSVRNSIPLVLEALATLLSESLSDHSQKLKKNSLEHGVVRAEQGYDITEILLEYSLLRTIIFTVLKSDLRSRSADEILQTVELINSVIDQVVSWSLEKYVEARLQELEELQGQLILTNQELTRLVAMQKEDISHLAHELKNPLNSIMGFSSLLLRQQQKLAQGPDPSLNLQLTEKVISSGKQLLRLINDTLEISRYEAGKVQLELRSVDVRSLIKVVVEAFEPSVRQKNLELIVECNRCPEHVQSDPLRLQQIVTNLVSNAIRYTESGTIAITCQAGDYSQWLFIVADTGIGIDLEAQSQIFEPYFRAGAQSSYSPHSTGLGLAIVNKLVELLQGKIELVSKLSQGTTFTITFPQTITASSEDEEPLYSVSEEYS